MISLCCLLWAVRTVCTCSLPIGFYSLLTLISLDLFPCREFAQAVFASYQISNTSLHVLCTPYSKIIYILASQKKKLT